MPTLATGLSLTLDAERDARAPARRSRAASGVIRRRWIVLLLAATFLSSRLFHLGLLPMVSDEGTYLTWGVRAWLARSPQDWLASLEDGKQPLLAWLMPPFLALVPDRLVAARLVSVCAGLANLALISGLGRRLYGGRAGWLAGLFYIVAPIALIHDRMALYDSLVATGALATLWTSLDWAERPDRGRTLALGAAMGLSLLTKLSALFFVGLVPVVILIWRPAALRRGWLLAQACFLAGAAYSVLYLSPIVNNIQDGNFQRYSLTAAEVLALPWETWWKNTVFVAEVAAIYLGRPLTALSFAGIGAGVLEAVGRLRQRGRIARPDAARETPGTGARRHLVIALWTLAPLLGFVLTAKIIYSRYIVFCLVLALLPAAYAVRLLPPRWLASAVTVIALVPGLAFAAPLLTRPEAAPWMNDRRYITDRFQYVESNYAGYGLNSVAGYLLDQARQGQIVVLTRSATGMPRDGITAYLLGRPNVQIGLIPDGEATAQHLETEPDRSYVLAARGAPLFYVLTDAPRGEQEVRFRMLHPGLEPIMELGKPGNHSRFQLYRVPWQPRGADVWLPSPVRVGGQIQLLGYQLASSTVRPGERIRLVLYWEATGRPPQDYTVFNHIIDGAGPIWGQHDGQPRDGRSPTRSWLPGDVIADVHELRVKNDAPPGAYDLVTGMYDLATAQRLPVSAPGGAAAHRIELGTVTVITPG